MGFLWPVKKENGVRKEESELSPSEKARIVDDIEKDQTANLQRGLKIDTKALEQGVRLSKGMKGREGFFDELLNAATKPTGKTAA